VNTRETLKTHWPNVTRAGTKKKSFPTGPGGNSAGFSKGYKKEH